MIKESKVKVEQTSFKIRVDFADVTKHSVVKAPQYKLNELRSVQLTSCLQMCQPERCKMAFKANQGRHAQLIFSWFPLCVHRGHVGTGFHHKQDYSMAAEMKTKRITQCFILLL